MDQPHLFIPENGLYQIYGPALGRSCPGRVLPYIKDNLLEPLARVGAKGIYLIGIFQSDADHGFGIRSYNVARSMGTIQDLRDLIERAHLLGLEVILDIVPNHVSRRHYLADECLRGNRAFQDALISFTPEEAEQLRQRGLPSFFGPDPYVRIGERCYLSSFVTGKMLDVNWNSFQVRQYFRGLMMGFRNMGVDGFRIDCGMMLMRDLGDLDPKNPMSSLRPAASAAAFQDAAGDAQVFYEGFRPREEVAALEPYENAYLIDCSFVLTNQPPDLSIRHNKLVRLYGGHDQLSAADRGLDMDAQFAATADDFVVFTDVPTAIGMTTTPGILPGDEKNDANLHSPTERHRIRRPGPYAKAHEQFVELVDQLFPLS